MNDTFGAIDGLLHDMEHAEAGADFARRMQRMQPNNQDHKDAEKSLNEKAARLRGEALELWKQAGVHHVECCPLGPDKDNLCDLCLGALEVGIRDNSSYEKLLTDLLKETPCSVCGKLGYFEYKGPAYGA